MKTITIISVHQDRVSTKEMISLPYNGPLAGWNETTTNRLTMTWDSKQLTDAPNSFLNISLMGYRETRNGVCSISYEQLDHYLVKPSQNEMKWFWS